MLSTRIELIIVELINQHTIYLRQHLVGLERLGLSTPNLKGLYSNQLSYRPKKDEVFIHAFK